MWRWSAKSISQKSTIEQSFLRKSFEFHNSTSQLLSIILEPWGEDYYLEPDDVFSIYHEANSQGYVCCDLTSDLLQVFLEGCMDYPDKVMINNEEVYCGHNRPDKV